MKSPFSGNRCLMGCSSIRRPSETQVLRPFKDRVTDVLKGNVAGYKLKCFVIWQSEHTLPVYYRSNKNDPASFP